ncbi:MAG TPA: hypothetical protein VF559_12625 [Caulobacteraceae bacterium]
MSNAPVSGPVSDYVVVRRAKGWLVAHRGKEAGPYETEAQALDMALGSAERASVLGRAARVFIEDAERRPVLAHTLGGGTALWAAAAPEEADRSLHAFAGRLAALGRERETLDRLERELPAGSPERVALERVGRLIASAAEVLPDHGPGSA